MILLPLLEVETTGDEVWENHSKIEMKIVSDVLYIIDTEGSVASTVVQDDEFLASEAVLSVSPNPIGEGMGKTTATITVITNGDKRPHGKITIPLTTTGVTATSGEDYSELGTTLTFSESDFAQIDLDGSTRYRAIETADISITQDSVDEDSESFNVAMGTPSNNLVALDSGSANTSVTITDDDVIYNASCPHCLDRHHWYANSNILLQPSLLYRSRCWLRDPPPDYCSRL